MKYLTLTVVALASLAQAGGRFPACYLFELDPAEDTTTFFNIVDNHGKVQSKMNYSMFHGASVTFDDNSPLDDTLATLSALPLVKGFWPVHNFDIAGTNQPTTPWEAELDRTTGRRSTGPSPLEMRAKTAVQATPSDAYSPYVMSQIDKLHAQGIIGKGIKIALINSGVDYTHPAFGGCFGDGCIVSGGYDFVGDDYKGYYPDEPLNPKPNPLEVYLSGQGTRSASIIAAQPTVQFNFSGVAPGAQLLVYKVSGKTLQTRTDIITAAIYRAFDDGADIIAYTGESSDHLTWGALNTDIIEQAASRAIENGVPVLFGFDSDSETVDKFFDGKLFHIDSISSVKGVEVVAKFVTKTEPMLLLNAQLTIDNQDNKESQDIWYQTKDLYPNATDLDLPIWALSLEKNVQRDACTNLTTGPPDLPKKFLVLVRTGGCDMLTKVYNVFGSLPLRAGGILFYSDTEGYPALDERHGVGLLGFVGVVSADLGQSLVEKLKNGASIMFHADATQTAQYKIQDGSALQFGGSIREGYSGPTQELEIKPTYGVPAGFSVFAVPGGGYRVADETGKASAFIAGAYALLAQGRSIKPNPRTFQTLLANSAKPQPHRSDITGRFESVAKQGAGIIQVFDAVNSKATVMPNSISFKDSDHAVESADLLLVNQNSIAVTYTIQNRPAITQFLLNDYKNATTTNATVNVIFSTEKVTIGPGESATIKVTPDTKPNLPNVDKLPLWSGYVSIRGSDGGSLSVPYLGVQGSLFSITPFLPGPGHAVPIWESFLHPLPEKGTIAITGPSLSAYVNVKYSICTPKLEVYIVSLDGTGNPDGKINGLLSNGPWKTQYTYSHISIGQWDGKVAGSSTLVPEGYYKLRFRGLRMFGDEKKAEDWQFVDSTTFYIKHPHPA